MIQDFQDNLVLAEQVENLLGWITLIHIFYPNKQDITNRKNNPIMLLTKQICPVDILHA